MSLRLETHSQSHLQRGGSLQQITIKKRKTKLENKEKKEFQKFCADFWAHNFDKQTSWWIREALKNKEPRNALEVENAQHEITLAGDIANIKRGYREAFGTMVKAEDVPRYVQVCKEWVYAVKQLVKKARKGLRLAVLADGVDSNIATSMTSTLDKAEKTSQLPKNSINSFRI